MIDTTNWGYYFKLHPIDKTRCCNNMMYTPLVSPDGSMLCMSWDKDSPYQQLDTKHILTDQLISFFFEREVKYLTTFKNYPWCPNIIEIDRENKLILIEWNVDTCNDIAYTVGRNLDVEHPNWEIQLFNILKDIVEAGYYKTSLYPHCFFFDKKGILKTFDFYACIEQSSPFIKLSQLDGMIGKESGDRFKEAIADESVNLEIFFKKALTTHVKWPNDPFPKFYKRLYND